MRSYCTGAKVWEVASGSMKYYKCRVIREQIMLKILLIIAIVIVCLFILSLIVYFFNLDMKLTSAIQPLLAKHYDKIKRDRKI